MNQRPFVISGALTVGEDQPEPKLIVAESCTGRATDTNDGPDLSLRSLRAQVEIKAIKSALKRTAWNRKQAARLLNISYRGLLYKIRRHNIEPGVEHS